MEVTHSRERASHQLQKELPQKDAYIDKGRGPQTQEEGAFERFQILGVWVFPDYPAMMGIAAMMLRQRWTLMVAGS